MDHHFLEYFHEFSEDSPSGNFHKVVALHDGIDIPWEVVSEQVPLLPRGWYELAHLTREDRIEFVHEFWDSRLEYHPQLSQFLERFFGDLDDIGIYLTQKLYDAPYDVVLVYSIAGDNGFYRGAPPASDDAIAEMQLQFPGVTFPADYLTFLQIHNGFYKTTDITGLYRCEDMAVEYAQFQEMIGSDAVYSKNQLAANPKSLIPFYESFGMPFYQCFWSEWYPEQEMGNVYYSGKQISDVSGNGKSLEHLAFATFTDWLIFYLERVD